MEGHRGQAGGVSSPTRAEQGPRQVARGDVATVPSRVGAEAATATGRVGHSRGRSRGALRRVRFERDSLAQVLGLVRSGDAVTRLEIEAASGLGRAVVADRLATLIERGLVEDGELGPSTGGRAPRHVRFRATAGHLLVASLGTTTLGVGLSDLSGRLLVEHHEAADATLGATAILDRVEALFDWMLEEHAEARDTWGIGLAVPGLVELPSGGPSSGATLHRMPGWRDLPVARHLGGRYGVPVWMSNEVHLMTLGEYHAGRGAGSSDLIFVKIGTGISAGLCSNGRVHRGAHGFAGDIGHVAVSDDTSVICRCGNTGCLEALAGGAAIAREARGAAESGKSPYLADVLAGGRQITATHVGMAANRGDPFSIELLSRSGRLVGETLATLVNAYNPSMVIVGGGVAQAGQILIAAIREALYRRSRSLATQNLQIVRAEMGRTAGLVGAALAVVDELFAPEYLRAWIDHGSPAQHPETGGTDAPRRGTGGGRRKGRRVSAPQTGTVAGMATGVGA
jgi:glucokinase-like ROK family protein